MFSLTYLFITQLQVCICVYVCKFVLLVFQVDKCVFVRIYTLFHSFIPFVPSHVFLHQVFLVYLFAIVTRRFLHIIFLTLFAAFYLSCMLVIHFVVIFMCSIPITIHL